jgi:hypothetical protein
VRRTISHLVMFKPRNRKETDNVFGELIFMDRELTEKLHGFVFDAPYRFLMADVDKGSLYKNFDRIIVNAAQVQVQGQGQASKQAQEKGRKEMREVRRKEEVRYVRLAAREREGQHRIGRPSNRPHPPDDPPTSSADAHAVCTPCATASPAGTSPPVRNPVPNPVSRTLERPIPTTPRTEASSQTPINPQTYLALSVLSSRTSASTSYTRSITITVTRTRRAWALLT